VTEPAELEALLTLQEHDGALDRLRHRRAQLPERAGVARGEADAAALATRLDDARLARDELAREEQRLDDEARGLAEKAKEVEARMYSGEVSSPRELQSMQADVDQLRRHQGGLENRELELMEAREPLDETIGELQREADVLTGELERLRGVLTEAESVIDGEARIELAARAALAGGIATALIADYERARKGAQGVGVARLVGNTCQGCHLSIPATEVERIKRAADGPVAHCDNCGCILVP